jgi:hypothetical protein
MFCEANYPPATGVFYDFWPFLSELIVEPQLIHRSAHHRPRLGTLEEIDGG